MHVDYFRFDEPEKEESVHRDHRFIFGERIDCKGVFEYAFGIGNERVIETYEVVSVFPDGLALVDCAEEEILEQAVLAEPHDSEGEAQEQEDDSEDRSDNDASD